MSTSFTFSINSLVFLAYVAFVFGQSTPSVNNDTQTPTSSQETIAPSTETTPTILQTTQVTVTESTQLDENTDLGPCICDLTANGCDVNCCCDQDCTEDDRNTFSECFDQRYIVDDKVCLQDAVVFTSNTPDYIEVTDSSLFCVQRDNYAERNFYTIPDSVTTIEEFNQLSSQHASYSYEVPSDSNPTYQDFYKSGDAIYTIYETLSLGTLGLPQPLTTGECVDTNPAAFLYDSSSSCVREVTDLPQMCESLPQLSAKTFVDGFKLVSTPTFLQENPPPEPRLVNTTTPTSMTTQNTTGSNVTEETTLPGSTVVDLLYYDNPELIPLAVLQPMCRTLINVDCGFVKLPYPTYNESAATCTNVLIELRYIITHNATAGIEAASVQAVLGDIQAEQLPLVQTFKISFEKSDQTEEPFRRSGNPGYIVGEPLLAGTRIELDGGTKLAIALRDDRNNWLTAVKSTPDGTCLTDADSRIPITFGEDIRTGCIISISLGSSSDVCGLIQDQILNALRGPMLSEDYYVAMFGDSSVEVVGDWVLVLHEDIAGTPSSPAVGTCSNMVTGLHIEVIYANVGSLQNPQPKILGVKYNYADGKLLKYQCQGSNCQSDSSSLTQKFEIASSVTFIDASTQPEAVIAERPSWQSKLPNDFLYPFTGSSMASSVARNSFAMVTLMLNLIVNFVT